MNLAVMEINYAKWQSLLDFYLQVRKDAFSGLLKKVLKWQPIFAYCLEDMISKPYGINLENWIENREIELNTIEICHQKCNTVLQLNLIYLYLLSVPGLIDETGIVIE